MNKQLIAYILISIVFLVVFGGIASILPSRKVRQLGHLRVAARKHGLATSVVQIDDVNASLTDRVTASGIKLDPKRRCVAWSKSYPDEFPDVPEWISFAQDRDDPSQNPWQLRTKAEESDKLAPSYWDAVDRIKALLPDRCLAVECLPTEVRWMGYELVSSSIEEFIQAMSQGLEALIDLNISISQEKSLSKNRSDTTSEYD